MFQISSEGLGAATALLKTLKALGASASRAEFNVKEREKGVANNAQIAGWLAERNRDFFSADDEMTKAIELAMVKAIEIELKKQHAMRGRVDRKGNKIKDKSMKQEANKVASEGLFAGMEAAKTIMRDRIDSQRTAGGGTPEPLTPAYLKWKQNEYGFTTIGKATGELLDNLAPGKRNTRLKR